MSLSLVGSSFLRSAGLLLAVYSKNRGSTVCEWPPEPPGRLAFGSETEQQPAHCVFCGCAPYWSGALSLFLERNRRLLVNSSHLSGFLGESCSFLAERGSAAVSWVIFMGIPRPPRMALSHVLSVFFTSSFIVT